MEYWTDDSGVTHIFNDTNMPPGEGFGWVSLCRGKQIPREGVDFELEVGVSEAEIECDRCRNRIHDGLFQPEDEEITRLRTCAILTRRDGDGTLNYARRLCQGQPLHYELQFEPQTTTGNLHDQVDTVCENCWQLFTEGQWSSTAEGGELAVTCQADAGERTYYGVSIEAVNTGRRAVVRLYSEDGLSLTVPREDITSISLTPAQIVDY